MAGQINIDSTDIEQTLSILGESVGTLEGETYSYVNDNYDVLEDLGLVDDSVTKVKKQINELVRNQNKVIVDLKNHLESYYETENEIVDFIKNFEGTDNIPVSTVEISSEYVKSSIDNTTGKNVTKGDAVKFIKSVSEEVEGILFENIRKNGARMDNTIDELVLDPKKSGLVTEIVKKVCGDTNTDIDVSNSLKTAKVQRTLANKMGKSHAAKLMKDTSLSALPYLQSEAEKEGFKLEDILYDPEKADIYFDKVNDLYLGNTNDSYTLEEINNFREYINSVAESVNKTAEELLSDKNNIGTIKKGIKK